MLYRSHWKAIYGSIEHKQGRLRIKKHANTEENVLHYLIHFLKITMIKKIYILYERTCMLI